MPLKFALRNIHFPSDQAALSKAQYRLKWEELFLLQLSLLKQKYIHSRAENGIPMPIVGPAYGGAETGDKGDSGRHEERPSDESSPAR